MEIKKTVDLETLTEEENEALVSGLKTEEDFLAEHEEASRIRETEREERFNKAEELASNYKIRAEKAEAKVKSEIKSGEQVLTPTNETLTPKDLMALMNAKVHEEDIEEVQEYARFKKISLAEALNISVIKTLLSEKAEQRKVADATNVGVTKRSPSKESDETLLRNASKGELPDTDEGLERLVRARKGLS